MIHQKITLLTAFAIMALVFSGCEPASPTVTGNVAPVQEQTIKFGSVDANSSATVTSQPATDVPTDVPTVEPAAQPTATATTQPTGFSALYGPQIGDFPPGINPMTGLPVRDASLLNLPVVLLSIPNFPVSARPQAGLSFSPLIFEIYIGYGETRYLTAFYGEEPVIETPVYGTCAVRSEPFVAGTIVLGNRAWLDKNQDGIQDPDEPGIGGICVTLLDANGAILQTTSTDSNGYYGFNVEAGTDYQVSFEKPAGLEFTIANVGFDDHDSDVNPATGMSAEFSLSASDLNWDAGYVQPGTSTQEPETVGVGTPTPAPDNENNAEIAALPPAEIGPIRSMRLPYEELGKFFQGGCIVSASGDPNVLAQVPGCEYVFGDNKSVNDAKINVTQLQTLAEENQPNYPVNYSGNLFEENAPSGGKAASDLNVIWNWQNQSKFQFDPLSGAYLRMQNTPDNPLEFTPQTDRLTGQELQFNNVIVMYVDYIAYAETLMNIDLPIGAMGRSDLFRNGQVYHIYWSTIAQQYEQETQHTRPIRFTDAQGNPFPLAPGHTWVNVFTTASVTYEKDPGSGLWTGEFHPPLVP